MELISVQNLNKLSSLIRSMQAVNIVPNNIFSYRRDITVNNHGQWFLFASLNYHLIDMML